MVLSRRDDGHEAGPSTNKFDGSDMDVGKIFFIYDNATMRNKSEQEKAEELLCYLDGAAFDFYFETFAKDGALLPSAHDYPMVKQALKDEFMKLEEPEKNIRQAITCKLEPRDLNGCLHHLNKCFEKAGFNPEAKFGLLRNAVMQIPDLAQFAIFRGAITYDDLKATVKDFVTRTNLFFSSRVEEGPELKPEPKRILKRPDNLERRADALTEQLAELSLLVKKNQSAGSPAAGGRICSYCKRSGHGANRCEVNPYRDTKCARCGKIDRPKSSCWMKVAPEAAQKAMCRVGFEEPSPNLTLPRRKLKTTALM